MQGVCNVFGTCWVTPSVDFSGTLRLPRVKILTRAIAHWIKTEVLGRGPKPMIGIFGTVRLGAEYAMPGFGETSRVLRSRVNVIGKPLFFESFWVGSFFQCCRSIECAEVEVREKTSFLSGFGTWVGRVWYYKTATHILIRPQIILSRSCLMLCQHLIKC